MDFEGLVNILSSADSQPTLVLNGDRGDLTVGGNGKTGKVEIRVPDGRARMTLEAGLNGGVLRIRNPENRIAIEIVAALNVAALSLGGSGFDGNVFMRNAAGQTAIAVSGRDRDIILNNAAGQQRIRLSGASGDVTLHGADAAEDFDIVEDSTTVLAGTVMVIDSAGKLRESNQAYDRRVAGVVSGGGQYKPGIVLGRGEATGSRRPIALAGKVFCKADATVEPIDVGDLLTPSTTPGHAMRASDPMKAFGAVIGKALQPLPTGRALIPVLVALQ